MSTMSVSTSSNDVKNIETGPSAGRHPQAQAAPRLVYSEGLDDTRISHLGPLVPPCCLLEQLPLSEVVADVVSEPQGGPGYCPRARDRLVCVVGPCSVHDPKAARSTHW